MNQRDSQDQWAEIWAEICFLLSLKVQESTAESAFQDKVLRAIEKLGWSQYRKEIEIQPTVQIGRGGSIRPDLVIYSPQHGPLITIEVKRPQEPVDTPSFSGQLFSYMRLMRADFGLLIGSEIQVFYDGGSVQAGNRPLLLDRIQFHKESESGWKFVEVFSKDNFLSKQYTPYVDEKIHRFQRDEKIKEVRVALRSNEIKLRVLEFLKKEFAAAFGEDIVEEAMKELVIEILVTPTISVIAPPSLTPVDKVKRSTLGREFRAGTSAQDIVDTIKSAGAKGIDLKTLLDKALKHGWAPRSTNPKGRVKRIARGSVKRGIVKLVDGKYIYIGGTPGRDGT